MKKISIQKFNTLLTGVLSATLLPVVIYFVMYFAKVQNVHHTLFSNHLVAGNILPVLLSHCVLPNLVLFFIFNSFDWMRAAKGVMVTTVVLTALIFLVKLIFSVI